MPPKLKFTEGKYSVKFRCRFRFCKHCLILGEKVLCFHGPLIYEAKLLKSMVMKDKQVKYFIHYAGWNKK